MSKRCVARRPVRDAVARHGVLGCEMNATGPFQFFVCSVYLCIRRLISLLCAEKVFYEGVTAFHFARKRPSESKWMVIGKQALMSFREWTTHSNWNWENKVSKIHYRNTAWLAPQVSTGI